MDMNHFNDTQVAMPSDSGCRNAFDNRSQSRFRNQQSFFTNSRSDFKKPRFSERNSYPRIPLSVNRTKLSIPYKSQLCMLFQRGKCYYGENCHFAHNISEITKPTFKNVAMVEQLKEGRTRNAMNRMEECHVLSSGTDCPYGDECHFLHRCVQNVRNDVGVCSESYAINAVNRGSDRSERDQIECKSMNAGEDYAKLVFRKTKLCINWERFGSCPYGEKCNYAHGEAELKELSYFAELEQHPASRSILDSQPNNAASCKVGIKTANELQTEGKRSFMNWDVEKISQIYADWMEIENTSMTH